MLVRSAAAAQAETCVYDAGTKAVTATIGSGPKAATLVVSGNQLMFGAVPAPCGAATATNTDSITINGEAGSNETLTLDHRGGFFGPGAAPESNLPEIEIVTALGDATDRVVVYGTEGPDRFAAGQNGFATSADGDLDIRFSPSAFILEVHLLGGDDYFNGRGESGAGLHFLGPIVATGGEGNESLLRGSSEPDSIDGGPGNDELRGQEANDVLNGGAGDDVLAGGGEDDTLIGGPGVDTFLGSDGADSIFAHDDERDLSVNGGPGFDIARVDVLDPTPVATEIVIRPSESCTYDGVSHTLALTMTPTSTATLVIHGDEIWWGEVPKQCGSATTTNTDSISIVGAVGTSETLILDQRGGFFGPGATPESNTPEIEISTALGDTNDRVIVYGTEERDYMAAGQSGMATSTDGDTDITFSPSTFQLDLHLLGGDDHFDARGTGGAGLKFLGPTTIFGGEGDDDLLRGSAVADVIDGGPGEDVLDAQDGDDILRGGPGNDTLGAGGGADSIEGGAGIDTMNGSEGDDTFYAQDDEADASISGGQGFDVAYIDTGVDPTPVTVEHVIGDDAPPPPPVTGCTYDAVTKAAKATLAPGATSTLDVDGAQIRFGTTPAACGAATTTNTDSILVTGAAGSVESTHDRPRRRALRAGRDRRDGNIRDRDLAPAGRRDRSRQGPRHVRGRHDLGRYQRRRLTPDTDVDVTWSPRPAVVEILGLRRPNTLSGRGGSGAGDDFPSKLILRAGDSGDTLEGGASHDLLYGGSGNDGLSGRDGNDTVSGGAGNDSVTGNEGDDELVGGAGVGRADRGRRRRHDLGRR